MLSLALTAVTLLSANAQTMEVLGQRELPDGTIAVQMGGQIPIGNPNHLSFPSGTLTADPMFNTNGMSMLGVAGQSHYDIASLINIPAWKGSKILGIGIGYCNKSNIKDIKGWYSDNLWSDTPDGEVTPVTHAYTNAKFEVKFNEPKVVGDKPFYLGWSFDNPNSSSTMVFGGYAAGIQPGGIMMRNNDGSWWDYGITKGYILCMDIFLEPAADMVKYAMKTCKIDRPVIVKAGQTSKIGLPIKNVGGLEVTNFNYQVTVNGTTSAKGKSLSAKSIVAANQSCSRLIELDAISEPGTYPVTVKINKVNGVDNGCSDNTVTFDVIVKANGSAGLSSSAVPTQGFTEGEPGYRGDGNTYDMPISCATKFFKPELAGMKIVGAKMTHLRECGNGYYNLWLSNTLGDTPTGEVAYGMLDNGAVEVAFTNPVDFPEEGIYVGMTTDVIEVGLDDSQTMFPIPFCEPKFASEAGMFRGTKGWLDYSSQGSICLTLYLQGEMAEDGCKIIELTGNKVFEASTPFNARFNVENTGSNPISSLEYTYNFGNGAKTANYTLDTPLQAAIGSVQTVKLPFEGQAAADKATATITVTKVNGNANTSDVKSCKADFRFVSGLPVKRVLAEEGTGTQCGWCPRGMVALQEMSKRYPEFIAAAYHTFSNTDPMYIKLANGMPFSYPGFPTLSLDRNAGIDPFFGVGNKSMGIADAYLEKQEYAAPASVDLKTSWGADNKTLNVEADVRFAYVEAGHNYSLGYLVTADGLKGEGAPWKQDNSFIGTTQTDPLLIQLTNGTFDLSTYNHVVIEASNYQGVTNSLSSAEAGKTFNDKQTLDLNNCTLTINPDKVHVIAFVIDKNTNGVVNARIIKAGESTTPDAPTGINEVAASQEGAAVYYDLQGRKVSNPTSGLFIQVKDNKARKVIL